MGLIMEKKYYGYLDILRILSAFAVIMIHVVTASVFTNLNVTTGQVTVCSCIHSIMNFSIAIFLMITGFIFLGNKINYTYQNMKKYLIKIVSALICFGVFYSMLEQIFTTRTIVLNMIPRAFYDIITGNLWDHMWYLYVVIGMYFIIPIIKPVFLNNKLNTLITITAIIYLFNIVIPEFEGYTGIAINFSIPINGGFLFYVFAGGCLAKMDTDNIKISWSIFGIIGSILLIIMRYIAFIPSFFSEYNSIIISILSISVFCLCRSLFKNYIPNKVVIEVSKCTWGIYLIHPFFLNIQLKLLGINPLLILPQITIVIDAITLFAISLLASYILRKIKFHGCSIV